MQILHDGKAVLIGWDIRVDDAFLDVHPGLQIIGSNTTGVDHIDMEACERRGLKVITLRGETDFLQNVTSTAEHTFGLILALARGYKTALHGEPSVGRRLNGKKLGIVGYGRVGRQVERIANGFGMVVDHYDDKFSSIGSLRGLLGWADYVSVHIPLEGNEGFFTKEKFAMMKSSAYFINTSRDGIVEPEALLLALELNFIAGAAVDFTDSLDLVEYEKEHNNLILTGHIGGATIEDRKLTEDFIIKKIGEYVV